ncbi:MAG: hypothetical protein ACLUKN_03460 [Bacilli bacterium]
MAIKLTLYRTSQGSPLSAR